jgi:outer membrane immunogenic protein
LFGSHLVLGGELFADWSDIAGSATVPTTLGAATFGTRIRSFGAALGRLGYAFDRTFVYFQGGLPYAVTQSYYNVGPYSGSSSVARFELGKQVAVGVGAEYALDDHWSLRADYLYSYVHAGWVYFNPAPNVNVLFTSRTSFHTGRVGLDYHFDLFAPPTPVMAKY